MCLPRLLLPLYPSHPHPLSRSLLPPPQITSIDIERDGVYFASGGADRLVKVWLYDEGEPVAVGEGHSGAIQKVRISPDKRIVVSVGSEGAIFIWRFPGK